MKRATTLVILMLLSLAGGLANADEGPGTKSVRETNEMIKALLLQEGKTGSPEEKKLIEDKIIEAIRNLLDTDELGRRALQDHLKTLKPAQVDEFLLLLRTLIEQSYVNALLAHRAYEVAYIDETGGATRTVATEVRTKRKGRPYTVSMDYQLGKSGSSWRAYDVVTDGVSLVHNYRAQFNRIIAKEGYQGLLARMQKRRAQMN